MINALISSKRTMEEITVLDHPNSCLKRYSGTIRQDYYLSIHTTSLTVLIMQIIGHTCMYSIVTAQGVLQQRTA